jgi:hypothetical protein
MALSHLSGSFVFRSLHEHMVHVLEATFSVLCTSTWYTFRRLSFLFSARVHDTRSRCFVFCSLHEHMVHVPEALLSALCTSTWYTFGKFCFLFSARAHGTRSRSLVFCSLHEYMIHVLEPNCFLDFPLAYYCTVDYVNCSDNSRRYLVT